ncbi:glycine dehydrogenase subunit 2 [Thioalkalivibrio paradoxus ARh 1]|uniref:Probable glycine dehydrogenase (decarboxylating) subunit 2 n=1 Tax=Thioalkalivibrio paradoxus ARh 1 TaxID=713585 RepID=W0DJY1_9GAMM|nr:glycine dehydrogenase subunit 2 [Thioalkalivibrio paradoxus ARh 1]
MIFDRARAGRAATAQAPRSTGVDAGIPDTLRRRSPLGLPAVSEMDVVRHYTRLSQKNFSIDTQFYPLGSCTMKYNPRACNSLAMLPELLHRHPLAPPEHSQGFLQTMFELQEMLREVTGMSGVSLTPMAGAQGEFAGVAMIRAYHRARGDDARSEIIVPDAAHGTNPATAIMCGYRVREIPTGASGDVDLDALRAAVGPQTAGIMLTNPSTLGVFERHIREIAAIVHDAGGLLYYDGANLNAILGKVRPGDMGFDVIHMNLHKTFSTPHGGGGPGAGAVGVSTRLLPFLPVPVVVRDDAGVYRQGQEDAFPQSIGRLSAFAGNAGVLLRAYVYMRMLGREGMIRVAEYSTLNANYLMAQLQRAGFDLAFPERRATHEFIVTLKRQAKETGLTAMDVAKRLLDHDYHAPTTYFPLLVPECLLIEPTETESRETLDGFVAAMTAILDEAKRDIDTIKGAPHRLPNRRFNEVAAAKRLDVVYRSEEEPAQQPAGLRSGTRG